MAYTKSNVSICATRTLREQQSVVSRQLCGTGFQPVTSRDTRYS
ncbi:hypothetical protein [Moorena sp. SIOASIH]|nr:hypothetical protein [Moorena sp. SIOASIH]